MENIVEAKSIDAVLPSPDGNTLAYRVIDRSVSYDRVTAQWFMVSLRNPKAPVTIGRPTFPRWMPQFDFIERPRAEWLQNGNGLLALQLDRSGSQIHWLQPNKDVQVTDDLAGIEDFRFAGEQLEVAVRRPLKEIEDLKSQEVQRGIHLDRTVPTEGMRLTNNYVFGDRTTTVRRRQFGDLLGEAYSGPLRWRNAKLPTGIEVQTRADQGHKGAVVPYMIGDQPLDNRIVEVDGSNRLLFRPITTATSSEEEAIDRIVPLSSTGAEGQCQGIACSGPSSAYRQIVYESGPRHQQPLA